MSGNSVVKIRSEKPRKNSEHNCSYDCNSSSTESPFDWETSRKAVSLFSNTCFSHFSGSGKHGFDSFPPNSGSKYNSDLKKRMASTNG